MSKYVQKPSDWVLHYFHRLQQNNFDCLITVSGSKGFGKSTASIYLARRYNELFSYVCPHCGRIGYKNFYAMRGKGNSETEFYVPDYLLNDSANIRCNYEYELDMKTGEKNISEGCNKTFKWSQRKPVPWKAETFVAYDNPDIMSKVFGLPKYSPVVCDESYNALGGDNHNKAENKEMKKVLNVIRPKRLLMFFCLPEISWLDSKVREGFSSFWLRMIERGEGVLFEKDKSDVPDHFHLKEVAKATGTIKFFTPMDKIRKNLAKIPTFFSILKIPDLPEKVYDDYEMVRNAINLQRRVEELTISNKDIAKLMTWNIVNDWDRIKINVSKSRENKVTYDILLRDILVNPVDRKSLVSEPTVRNWIRGVDDFVKTKGKDAHEFDFKEK